MRQRDLFGCFWGYLPGCLLFLRWEIFSPWDELSTVDSKVLRDDKWRSEGFSGRVKWPSCSVVSPRILTSWRIEMTRIHFRFCGSAVLRSPSLKREGLYLGDIIQRRDLSESKLKTQVECHLCYEDFSTPAHSLFSFSKYNTMSTLHSFSTM